MIWRVRRLLRAVAIPDINDAIDTFDLVDARLVASIRRCRLPSGSPVCDLDDEGPQNALA